MATGIGTGYLSTQFWAMIWASIKCVFYKPRSIIWSKLVCLNALTRQCHKSSFFFTAWLPIVPHRFGAGITTIPAPPTDGFTDKRVRNADIILLISYSTNRLFTSLESLASSQKGFWRLNSCINCSFMQPFVLIWSHCLFVCMQTEDTGQTIKRFDDKLNLKKI